VKLDIELQLSGKLLRDADSDMIIYIGNLLVSESLTPDPLSRHFITGKDN
jgi:hypothetical protein